MNPTPTLPEAPETLAVQLAWLRAGRRRAVLVTVGAALPELPPECDVFYTPHGLLVFHPAVVSVQECLDHLVQDTLGLLLGYGVPRKPAPSDDNICVTLRSAGGLEKQAVLVAPEEVAPALFHAALTAAAALSDAGDHIHLEHPNTVLNARLRHLQRQPTIVERAGALHLDLC